MVIEKLGRYVIVEELGQGAMGVVYKAVDPLIDRTVAIKTINLDLSRDELETFEKRFQREVQSAGKLNHPNIVTIYDVGRAEGVAYMAMEFLQGKELREILDSGVVLPIEKVVHIAAQVCDGLAFAHEHGIVHRDIKPANIMVLKNGMVKITDFGIAQVSSASRTMAGMVMGSPKYMSPEQVVGQTVDGRSDIFSLGVVLYEMLTGKTPFVGDNISAIMYQILNEEPIPPKAFNQNIPDSINYIVLKALAKQPDARYQTAKELARDLRKYKTLVVPAPGENPAPAAPLERRRTPRDSLGDKTQVIARLSEEEESPPPAPAAARRRWPHWALLAGIPLLLAVFIGLIVSRKAPAPLPQVAAPPVVVAEASSPKAEQAAPTSATPEAPAASPDAPAAPPGAQGEKKQAEEKTEAKPTPPAGKMATKPAGEATAARREKSEPRPKAAPLSSTAESRVVEHEAGPAAGTATLLLAISPWGEVFVDGVRQGVSPPLRELKVAPGEHRILIVNQTFAPYTETIRVEADGTHKIKYKFSK